MIFIFFNFLFLSIFFLNIKSYNLFLRPIHFKDFKNVLHLKSKIYVRSNTITALFTRNKQRVYQEIKSKKCLQYSILINYVQIRCIRKPIPLLFLCAYCFYSFIYSSMKKDFFVNIMYMLKSILKFYEYFKTHVRVIYLAKILAWFNITICIK